MGWIPAQRTTGLLQDEAILPSEWGLSWVDFNKLSIIPRPTGEIYGLVLIGIILIYLLSVLQQGKLWFPLSCAAAVNGNRTAVSVGVVL